MQYSIKHVHYRFLPLICTAVTNKSLNTRRNIFQFLEQILHVWPLHILEVGKSFFKDLEFFMDLNQPLDFAERNRTNSGRSEDWTLGSGSGDEVLVTEDILGLR